MPYKCDGRSCTARHDVVKKMGCAVPGHTSPECWHVPKHDKNYAAELELLEHDYLNDIEDIAARARDENIVPFCKRHDVRFSAGMGTYGFFDKDGKELCSDWERGVDDYTQPAWDDYAPEGYADVYRVLNTPATLSSLLFEFMSDYNPEQQEQTEDSNNDV